MMAAMVDLFCASWDRPPAAITLHIDDTVDAVHGHQQLSLFHAHYDTRCFLPIHIYEVTSAKPVAVILRPGKTPDGREVRSILKHVTRRIRRNWPAVRILWRGDGHYARPEAMDWCEDKGARKGRAKPETGVRAGGPSGPTAARFGKHGHVGTKTCLDNGVTVITQIGHRRVKEELSIGIDMSRAWIRRDFAESRAVPWASNVGPSRAAVLQQRFFQHLLSKFL